MKVLDFTAGRRYFETFGEREAQDGETCPKFW